MKRDIHAHKNTSRLRRTARVPFFNMSLSNEDATGGFRIKFTLRWTIIMDKVIATEIFWLKRRKDNQKASERQKGYEIQEHYWHPSNSLATESYVTWTWLCNFLYLHMFIRFKNRRFLWFLACCRIHEIQDPQFCTQVLASLPWEPLQRSEKLHADQFELIRTRYLGSFLFRKLVIESRHLLVNVLGLIVKNIL